MLVIHSYRLVYPDSPHAPEMLWEWERPSSSFLSVMLHLEKGFASRGKTGARGKELAGNVATHVSLFPASSRAVRK